jgi:hypothetical protein
MSLEINLLLGWITATLPAKKQLMNRDRLVNAVKARTPRKDWKLLEGLEDA